MSSLRYGWVQRPQTCRRVPTPAYRGRAGSNLAVLTAEGLPAPSGGKTYQAWVLQGDQWTSLGTFMPDADGTARVIAENSVLASSPNAVEVTVESAGRQPDAERHGRPALAACVKRGKTGIIHIESPVQRTFTLGDFAI